MPRLDPASLYICIQQSQPILNWLDVLAEDVPRSTEKSRGAIPTNCDQYDIYQFVNSGNASAITADGLIDFVFKLKVGSRQNATWLMNPLIQGRAGQLPVNAELWGRRPL
jgi:hypothetical protein